MTASRPEQMLKELQFQLTVTRAMLGTLDLDQVLFIILSGITHGEGLDFNRAFLFLADDAGRELRISTAVGPASEAEAHRIWEEMEERKLDLEQLLDRFETSSQHPADSLAQRMLGFTIPLTASAPPIPEDEEAPVQAIVARCAHTREPFFSNRIRAVYQPPPAEGGESLVFSHVAAIPLTRQDGVLGVILADNHYNSRQVEPDEMRGLVTLANMASIAIEKARLHSRLKEMAALDGLTGVFNRRHYEMRLQQEVARARRAGRSLALLVFDIDHFKDCNDRFGHECGDHVLKDVAQLLNARVRSEDLVARYGGEEFVVLLTGGATLEESRKVADKLRKEIESASLGGRDPGEVTISAGVASLDAGSLDGAALFRLADQALFKAKQSGRNRVETAS
ncbi:MAG: sensor domain-containing diguanylate cyclase [Deltaproteobacteria bacterium]|nr:sensor domain-containing diguanylate cyclase [Deltaproteobacteria bacterium]